MAKILREKQHFPVLQPPLCMMLTHQHKATFYAADMLGTASVLPVCFIFCKHPHALKCTGGIPYVYPVEREHVIWHEEFHGELHHQACCAVLPDREDGFVWVVGEPGQVLPFLLRQHHGQRQHT